MSYQEAKERLTKVRETAFYDQLAQASAVLNEAVRKARETYEATIEAVNAVDDKIEAAAQGEVDLEVAQKLSSEAYQLRYNTGQLIVSGTISASKIAAGSVTAGSGSTMSGVGRL